MKTTVADRILGHINAGNEGIPADIADQLGLNRNTVRRVTNELRVAGEIAVIDVYRGAPVYGAPELIDGVVDLARDEAAGL